MVVYNVTTKVDQAVASEWLQWMKSTHIPGIIATGCFTHAVILEVLETDTSDGFTYAVQYHAETGEHYNRYIKEHADHMRTDALNKWGNKIISFRSVLKVID